MITAKEAYKISEESRVKILTPAEKVEQEIKLRALCGFSYLYIEAEYLGFTKEKVDETVKILEHSGYKITPWGESFEIRWDK